MSKPSIDRQTYTETCIHTYKHQTNQKLQVSLLLAIIGETEHVENSERDGNTRPPLEKSVCRSGSNS